MRSIEHEVMLVVVVLSVAGCGVPPAENQDAGVDGRDSGAVFIDERHDAGMPEGNRAPTVRATANARCALRAACLLQGTVTDDGLPNPPGIVTSRWSMLSGPMAPMFGDASAPSTTATFEMVGDYTLELTGFDSTLSASDRVLVTVQGPSQPRELSLSLDASVPGLPGKLSGVMPEGHGHLGPYVDGNGNLYTVVEDFLANKNEPRAMKSKDLGRSWSEIDAAHRPSTGDLEGTWLIQRGTAIYLLFQKSSGHVYLSAFNTSDAASDPDSWFIQRELVQSPSPDDQYVTLGVLSNRDLWAFYSATTNGGLERVGYRRRTSANSAWGSETLVPASFSVTQFVSVVDEADTLHLFYKDDTNRRVYYRSLSNTGTLSAELRVDSGGTHSTHSPLTNPVMTRGADGTRWVTIAWANSVGMLLAASVDASRNVSLTHTLSSSAVVINPGITTNLAVVAHLAAHGDTVHAVYADAASQDIWHSANAHRLGWSQTRKLIANVTTQWLSGLNVLEVRGKQVLAILYDTGPHGDDGGDIRYDDRLLE